MGPVLFLVMLSDMPDIVGLENNPCRAYVAYADDICVWSFGHSVKAVKNGPYSEL